jgi:Uma2 family endonuclease
MATAVLEPDFQTAPDVPDDYELVHGKLVECKPMSAYAVVVANAIQTELILSGLTRRLGRSLIEQYFRIPTLDDPRKIRRPDLAFITFETWPAATPLPRTGNALSFVPEIAVEVISPGNLDGDDRAKRRDYLQAGVRSVWVVYPEEREIYCYTTLSRTPRVFGEGDTLTDPVLPGFEMKIDGLFPPMESEPRAV